MAIVEIENLLNQVTGLQAASMGTIIDGAVAGRMLACGLDRPDDYFERMRLSPSETQLLIEDVVVAETWFFRDRQAFKAMTEFVTTEWLPGSSADASLRVLSVPCSSGEEPFSIAMALLDAGVPRERFTVDAVDISLRALSRARSRLYGTNSFREADLDFRDRYFRSTPDGWELGEAFLKQVHFRQGNIVAPDFQIDSNRYDMIFCRNLLIYFDRSTQEMVIKRLSRFLTDAGIMFVGPAESYLATSSGFSSYPFSGAFAVRKRRASDTQSQTKPASTKPIRTARQSSLPRRKALHPPQTVETLPSEPPIPLFETRSCGLDRATELADAGSLNEAAAVCEEYLRVNGASAAAYYILGVVRDAQDRPAQAIAYYRKTLYLEPNHRDALTHMALSTMKQGDTSGAQRLRDRARRARSQDKV